MADSIREQIIQAFATRISAQRSGQVSAEQTLPARAVWDLAESSERTSFGKLENTLTLSVGIMDRVDLQLNNSVQANALLAELLDDALNQDATLGDLCERINYTGSTIDYPAPGQSEMAVLAEFEIVYRTSSRTPYQK